MTERRTDDGPWSLDDLKDPAFLAHLNDKYPGPVPPDPQDYDETAVANTVKEQAHQYRLAQGRKLMRLFREWKAGQN